MESADLEPSAFDSSTRMALLFKLTIESEAKLQELLAVKQFAVPALEEGQPDGSSSSNGTNESGDSGVVAASKYLELLEEEQACLKHLEELIKAKEMSDRDNQKSAEKQVPTERARAFTW